MQAHFHSVLLFFVLPVLSAASWCQTTVQVVNLSMPELAWNTNTVELTLLNPAGEPRTVIIHVQTRNHGGAGWDTEHTLAAGESVTIDREFFMLPFPGEAKVVVTIREKDGPEVLRRQFNTEFALENKRIAKLHITVQPAWAPYGPLAPEYPPLEMARRGQFVFYYPSNFAYVSAHLAEIADARGRVYRKLRRVLNPSFDDLVAVYLFPDEPTKFAYTRHQGKGMAFDHVLAEASDAKNPIDPNHELVHIMTGALGNPPAMFNEGLAVYLQEHSRWEGYPVDDWARGFEAAGMLMPISQLFALKDIGPKGTRAWVTYPESGSMVKYLVQRYGFGRVMEAFRELKSGASEQQNAAIFRRIFGVGLERFERDWLNRLRQEGNRVPQQLVEEAREKIKAGK